MRLCAVYGEVPDRPAEADMQEVRMDVFGSVPEWADENTIVTMAGRTEVAVPKDFRGLADVGDLDVRIGCRTVRSFHNFTGTPALPEMMFSLAYGGQWISKYAATPRSFGDLHTLYRAAKATERRHIVLGMGELGAVTRIRSRVLDNYLTFGYVGKPTAEGQFSLEEMKRFGDDCIVTGIAGCPLGHTRSPQMQNAAMEKAGINGIYLRFGSPDLSGFGEAVREYDIRGMNVTIPFKREVMEHLDSVEGPAGTMGAVNTVVNDGGKLIGINTDHIGVRYAFERAGRPIAECGKVLVFGTGGAARSAVYAAMDAGCETYVMGRNPEHTDRICRELGCERASGKGIGRYGAVINCTPVGMEGGEQYMFDPADLRPPQTVMDMVYNRKTRLAKAAETRKCTIASGLDMLVGQGAASFERWFGIRPDTDVMRRAAE